MKSGTLYIVATPIGNLDDLTIRAINVLKNAEYIACEDTRKTNILLKKIKCIQKPYLISYHDHSEKNRIPNLINLLKNNKDVVLVSDSGTPLISDPGYPLVRKCLDEGINVVSVPGPSAVTSSLVTSGQPPDKFIFLGFLPKKEGNRIRLLNNIKNANTHLESTVIIYEAPHRLLRLLDDLESSFGNIKITLTRELTKIHEETINLTISDLKEKYKKIKPRGEYVILFNPKTA